jgi:hypothetical protein
MKSGGNLSKSKNPEAEVIFLLRLSKAGSGKPRFVARS